MHILRYFDPARTLTLHALALVAGSRHFAFAFALIAKTVATFFDFL